VVARERDDGGDRRGEAVDVGRDLGGVVLEGRVDGLAVEYGAAGAVQVERDLGRRDGVQLLDELAGADGGSVAP
jgi:hypothetical protein